MQSAEKSIQRAWYVRSCSGPTFAIVAGWKGVVQGANRILEELIDLYVAEAGEPAYAGAPR